MAGDLQAFHVARKRGDGWRVGENGTGLALSEARGSSGDFGGGHVPRARSVVVFPALAVLAVIVVALVVGVAVAVVVLVVALALRGGAGDGGAAVA